MSDSGVQEVYVYAGMRLVPETRLLLVAEKLAAAEAETTAALAWFKDSEQRLKAAEARSEEMAHCLRWLRGDIPYRAPETLGGVAVRVYVPLIDKALAPPPEAEKRGEG